MPSFKRSNTETVHPTTALKYKSLVDLTWQRTLVEEHAEKLGRMITSGEFLTGHIVFAIMPDGSQRCANGQHTIEAIILCQKPARCLVEWYSCSDNEDYARLFHAYDTELRKRTWLDNAKAFIMGSSIGGDISPTQLNLFRAGVEYFHKLYDEGSGNADTRYQRFDMTSDYESERAFFVHLDEIRVEKGLLHKIPVISAIIGSVRSGGAVAREFWDQVMTGLFKDGDVNHPAYRLHQYIRGVTIQGGGGTMKSFGVRTGQKFQTQFDVFCACVRCWNAYARGESLSMIRGSIKGKVPTIYMADQMIHAA